MSARDQLREGQFAIDGFKFGFGTPFEVSNWDTGGYDVAPGDYQPSRQDNLRFGNDFFVPTLVTWEMACRRNKYLDNMGFVSGSRPPLAGGISAVDELSAIWKGDDIRQIYGAVKYVTYKRDGVERRFYGRPRQFASAARTGKSEWIPIVCNFQRADTFTYSEEQSAVACKPGVPARLTRGDGSAPAWVDITIQGPIANPIINLGGQVISLPGVTVGTGQILTISSYPWDRRIVRSDGINLRPKLVTPYLDQVYLRPKFDANVSISGTGTSAVTTLFVAWREAYNTL